MCLLGGWSYALYSGALLCYNHTQNSVFVIASGAILGVGASFLWVAQGAVGWLLPPDVFYADERVSHLDHGLLSVA